MISQNYPQKIINFTILLYLGPKNKNLQRRYREREALCHHEGEEGVGVHHEGEEEEEGENSQREGVEDVLEAENGEGDERTVDQNTSPLLLLLADNNDGNGEDA